MKFGCPWKIGQPCCPHVKSLILKPKLCHAQPGARSEAMAQLRSLVCSEGIWTMVRLAPISTPARKKHLGLLKGKVKVPDDFNAALDDEILSEFEGR
jgi:hypothetical protein